jgi:hypothetical protein
MKLYNDQRNAQVIKFIYIFTSETKRRKEHWTTKEEMEGSTSSGELWNRKHA